MLLKLDNVEKKYAEFDLSCSMEVKQGYVTGLIGQNGAGKSTTFKAILGLIDIDGGNIELFDKHIDELTLEDRQNLGVVLSDSGFSGYLTVKDIVPVMDKLYDRFDRKSFIDQCSRFNVPMDKKIKEFSTGMKAKLKVLTAISHEAKLLILDEPTAGLDVIARDKILDILREYMEEGNRSILISSHISSDLEGLCDDIYMIDGGRIILHEETDIMLSDYGLLKVSEEQYMRIDKQYLLRRKRENYGYSCLTKQKQFYIENYPEIAVEKGSIDEVITMMIQGE